MLTLSALAGCAAPNDYLPIADLREIPQNCRAALGPDFADRLLLREDQQVALAADYRRKLLSPWDDNYTIRPAAEVRALFTHWQASPGLGENLLPRDPAQTVGLLRDANLDAYPNCSQRAITVRNTSFRQLPTVEPAFLLPGEGLGYPFDRLQESAVWADTPIAVCHASKSGSWLWAESCYSAGWVPANDVAFVDDATVATWRTHPLVAIVRDGVSLRGPEGVFLASVGVGAVLPCDDSAPADPRAAISVRDAARMPDGTAKNVIVKLSEEDAKPWPLRPTRGALADLAGQMLGQSYGWGGLYELRDCSAMTRDLLAPIGLYLPRNSSEQAGAGKVVPLEGPRPRGEGAANPPRRCADADAAWPPRATSCSTSASATARCSSCTTPGV